MSAFDNDRPDRNDSSGDIRRVTARDLAAKWHFWPHLTPAEAREFDADLFEARRGLRLPESWSG